MLLGGRMTDTKKRSLEGRNRLELTPQRYILQLVHRSNDVLASR